MSSAAKTMAADLRDHLIRILRDQCGTTSFRDLDEGEQARIKDTINWEVAGATRKAVSTIASIGFEHVAVAVDAVTIKKDVKLGFILTERSGEAMDILARSYGKSAVVVFADPAIFLETQGDLFDEAAAEADITGTLPVEASDDEAVAEAVIAGVEASLDATTADVDQTTAAIVAAVEADVAANGSTDPEPTAEEEEPERHVARGLKVGTGRPVKGRRKVGNVFANTQAH